jgi:diguanylate cyclase (GGDEF)-like protein
LAHARRGRAIAVVCFDVDDFKRVNDEWGHETGDRVLARVGSILSSETRDVDVVARFGGEEFTVLLPGSDVAGADAFTQRIRCALAAPDGSGLPAVRVSAGIAAAVAPAAFAPPRRLRSLRSQARRPQPHSNRREPGCAAHIGAPPAVTHAGKAGPVRTCRC